MLVVFFVLVVIVPAGASSTVGVPASLMLFGLRRRGCFIPNLSPSGGAAAVVGAGWGALLIGAC